MISKLPVSLTLVAALALPLVGSQASDSPAPSISPGDREAISTELQRLFDEDQADRRSGIRGEELRERDRKRRRRLGQLLGEDLIVEPDDRYNAALIFQHSTEAQDILKAHALASAAAFDGHQRARWLAAASLDRYLEYRDEEQFFGTQFERDESGLWQPGRTDPALTPSMREAFALPTMEELRERAEEWN